MDIVSNTKMLKESLPPPNHVYYGQTGSSLKSCLLMQLDNQNKQVDSLLFRLSLAVLSKCAIFQTFTALCRLLHKTYNLSQNPEPTP